MAKLIGFGIALLLLFFKPATSAQLTVRITDITNVKGHVMIGIFNNESDYPVDGKQFRKIYLKVEATELSYTFTDMPLGDYAICVYHDENDDKICNLNLFGAPTEEYGFSNNVRPFLSCPSFKQTKFSLSGNQTISIKIEK